MPDKSTEIYESIWARKGAAEEHGLSPGTRLDVASRLLTGGGVLLDVGCGHGVFGAAMLPRYAEVWGADVSDTALRMAEQRGLRTRRLSFEDPRLPYDDACVDAVSCLDVLEHVLDPRASMAELARVVRPGGQVVVTTPNIRYWKHLRALVVGGRFPWTSDDQEAYDGGHLHYYTSQNLIDLMTPVGLLPERVEPVRGRAVEGAKSRLARRLLGDRAFADFMGLGIAIAARRR